MCPLDLAIAEGIDVRLEAITSLEGMYSPDGPTIILGSLRPRGRRAFTCAHELGHHVFGHGLRVDELLEDDGAATDDAEYVANRFAAALLMPKIAVLNAFEVRGWSASAPTPEQVYIVAGQFGVGYTTLIGYLHGTLRQMSARTADTLEKVSPKSIRASIARIDAPGVIVVDQHWSGRPVDAEVGDVVLVPPAATITAAVAVRVRDGVHVAHAPGTATIEHQSWRVTLRVSRAAFRGLAAYRHLEESDDDD